jgi:hypothetical protein
MLLVKNMLQLHFQMHLVLEVRITHIYLVVHAVAAKLRVRESWRARSIAKKVQHQIHAVIVRVVKI